jgi:ribosomal protein S18 acetylase RimI-like enzyme
MGKAAMVAQIKLSVRSAKDSDRQHLANIIHFETRIHRHLDWRAPLEWIGHEPFLVAESDGNIIAALACPPDPVEVAWIRLFAVASPYAPLDAWNGLWSTARDLLIQTKGVTVAAIPLQQWFQSLLDQSNFYQSHNVVLLSWQRGSPIPAARYSSVRIRLMTFDDLHEVARIDGLAFGTIWRNSYDSVELSFRQSALATIAEDDEGIKGYQISTASPMGGHLARLAVLPDMQGKGIGYALVRDALDQFERRGALRVTVNTQEENLVSISLYGRLGFRMTGEKYPVYQYDL